MRKITILGSTGSIGQQTLDVIARHPDLYQVYALTANTSVTSMLQDCLQFHPEVAVLRDPDAAARLEVLLRSSGSAVTVLSGEQALCDVASASCVDVVMAGIVGGDGLSASLAAAQSGKTVLLANKEALVMSGTLFMDAAKHSGATIIPVDSEHNAVFQCWHDRQYSKAMLDKIYLTASGGPFLHYPAHLMKDVTPAQAVAHPNWSMGQKISVDSATMMNKALELIEASFLFEMPYDDIGVVLHPQSTVHAFVAYQDGSVIAHMGEPDMRIPISYALGWPTRIQSGAKRLRLLDVATELTFLPLNEAQFPCMALARSAAARGQAANIVLNAANEVAVAAFLAQRIRYTDIARVIDYALTHATLMTITSIVDVLTLDAHAKDIAKAGVNTMKQEAPLYV
jgi:1-deoxy-D-xylulose-5-phosphate reductoisomerase